MTVGELIEVLKVYPGDARVTSYHGGEDTGFVSLKGIRYEEVTERGVWDDKANCRFYGPTLDIMGF